MRVLTRPAKPSTWDATVRQTRQDIENDVLNGKKPDFDGKEHWRDFKKDLEDVDTKSVRCAYCEVSLIADRFRGDVEHYRPKAAATDRSWYKNKGRPVRGTKNRCKPGYYWLAYEWSNLLLACFNCNRKKANFFPLVGVTRRRTLTSGCERTEKPLLLNPYDDKYPEKHLEFGTLGEVTAAGTGTNQARGQETIEICDLDRDDLRKEREAIAELAHQNIKEYLAATVAGNSEIVRVLGESLRLQMRANHPHSGMVRIIFYQLTQQHWTAL